MYAQVKPLKWPVVSRLQSIQVRNRDAVVIGRLCVMVGIWVEEEEGDGVLCVYRRFVEFNDLGGGVQTRASVF